MSDKKLRDIRKQYEMKHLQDMQRAQFSSNNQYNNMNNNIPSTNPQLPYLTQNNDPYQQPYVGASFPNNNIPPPMYNTNSLSPSNVSTSSCSPDYNENHYGQLYSSAQNQQYINQMGSQQNLSSNDSYQMYPMPEPTKNYIDRDYIPLDIGLERKDKPSLYPSEPMNQHSTTPYGDNTSNSISATSSNFTNMGQKAFNSTSMDTRYPF